MAGLVLCALGGYISPCVGSESPETPIVAPSGPPFMNDQLSSAFSSILPVVSQLLSPSGDGNLGDTLGGGFGVLYDAGKKAVGALSTSLASDDAREGLWVPLHEQLGLVRDVLGLRADDSQGVRNAAGLLIASQLPLRRFASEREACTDPEADQKALKLVTEYPASKKMLTEYIEQTPDRNLRAAPAELEEIHAEMNEYLTTLRDAVEGQVLPVSILGGLDTLSSTAAIKINGYLATVTRYFMYGDRFSKNKRGLVFFSKHILPRILQLFALQLDGCRYIWRFIAEVSADTGMGPFDPQSEALFAPPKFSFYDGYTTGTLGAIAQNLGFRIPSTPYAHGRSFGRRLLARVQIQLGALFALSRGCLAATSLTFQRQYAEAQDKVELGEAPSTAFLSLLEQSEQLIGGNKAKAPAETAAQAAEKRLRANPRLRALTRGGALKDEGKEEKVPHLPAPAASITGSGT